MLYIVTELFTEQVRSSITLDAYQLIKCTTNVQFPSPLNHNFLYFIKDMRYNNTDWRFKFIYPRAK